MRQSLLILIFLWSCNSGGQKAEKRNITGFNTTYASVLFFKNLRSPYYRSIENNDQSILSFMLKERKEQKDRIILQPCINIHQYEDKASVTLKINREIQADTGHTIEWQIPENGGHGKIHIHWQHDDHTQTAIEIYHLLKEGAGFILDTGDERAAILQNRDDRESFRITMADLLRLIEAD